MLTDRYLPHVIAHWGPVVVTSTVANSLLASAILIALAFVIRLQLSDRPSRLQSAMEMLLDHLDGTMRAMFGRDPRPYLPLILTLALFIGMANLMGLVPGLHAPTGDLSTTAALAIIVFVAVPLYGLRAQGFVGYLRHYLEPAPILLPLEIITELTRTLTLAVRLFGNVMSEELVIGVLLLLAGLLIPVPLMMLSVLTSVLQAYIFSILTVVYLSAVVRAQRPAREESP
jgi:F-type H+-transporting ATPase subunit a